MRLCAICGKPVKDSRAHLCLSCQNFIDKQEEKEKEEHVERSKRTAYFRRRESYQR